MSLLCFLKLLPQVADFIYKELTLDCAAVSHPVMHERIRLIFLGEKGLLQDLRSINTGRPGGKYDVFFAKLGDIVEQVSAADERRHNMAHLSQWISLRELINEVKEKCPPETPIPSKSLVRLQFSPRNPYAHAALDFTSTIKVQYKIQRRQLRLAHQDDHYCSAQLKYFQSKENVKLFFCDDKVKVPIGEPDAAISTGVRGKKTLAPSSTTLVALDHDMGKASLTPSVVLECDIPESPEKSFVRGEVTVAVNDSIYQASSPFRHAAMITKIVEKDSSHVPILMKFTDGGTDQRNTLESVRLAQIGLFKCLNLDMLILARCAPGHSWINPAERVMSILNIGLQNCALERKRLDEDSEIQIKKCGNMAELRKKENLSEKWAESIEHCQATVKMRFARLALKDKPMKIMDAVNEQEIDAIKMPLRELFPELDLAKMQKVHTHKNAGYMTWVEKHCRMRHYNFQIRKCDDIKCCTPPQMSKDQLIWLPDPVLADHNHFKEYDDVKDTPTTENDRPSLKPLKPENKMSVSAAACSSQVQIENDDIEDDTVPCSGQNSRATIQCVECNKPRVIYSKTRLSERAKLSLSLLMSEYEYTCGSPLTPPSHYLAKALMLRRNLCCAQGVELSYYSTGNEIGRKDLCSCCGCEGAVVDQTLKQRYKTVLPLCQQCKDVGRVPTVQRPHGKQKGKCFP